MKMMDWERSLLDLVERETSMRDNGLELTAAEPGHVCISTKVQARYRNSQGMVHGGFLLMMSDNAAGLAAYTDGRRYVTQNSSFQFLSNVGEGRIDANATVLHRGRTVTSVRVEVTSENGKLLCEGLFSMFAVQPKAPAGAAHAMSNANAAT